MTTESEIIDAPNALELVTKFNKFLEQQIAKSPDNSFYSLPEEILVQLPEEVRGFYNLIDPMFVYVTSSLLLAYFYAIYGLTTEDAEDTTTELDFAKTFQADINSIFSTEE